MQSPRIHVANPFSDSRFYTGGTSEEYLGDLEWAKRGLVMETKIYPTAGKGMPGVNEPEGGWNLTPTHIGQALDLSLKSLKTDKIDMYYLHAPDRTVPLEETLRGVDEQYRAGKFARFAISNFQSWEVARLCEICKERGYVMPSVYQGIYNALFRAIEPELLPCLRHYGIAFYAYNPLAGGYLTDRYKREDSKESHEAGSRFDSSHWQGRAYRGRYWNDAYFDALELLRPVAKKHGLTEAECALRWMNHHSQLKRKNGDGIIIGASSKNHIEQNLKDFEKGPLPDDVVQALDQGWDRVKGISSRYWH